MSKRHLTRSTDAPSSSPRHKARMHQHPSRSRESPLRYRSGDTTWSRYSGARVRTTPRRRPPIAPKGRGSPAAPLHPPKGLDGQYWSVDAVARPRFPLRCRFQEAPPPAPGVPLGHDHVDYNNHDDDDDDNDDDDGDGDAVVAAISGMKGDGGRCLGTASVSVLTYCLIALDFTDATVYDGANKVATVEPIDNLAAEPTDRWAVKRHAQECIDAGGDVSRLPRLRASGCDGTSVKGSRCQVCRAFAENMARRERRWRETTARGTEASIPTSRLHNVTGMTAAVMTARSLQASRAQQASSKKLRDAAKEVAALQAKVSHLGGGEPIDDATVCPFAARGGTSDSSTTSWPTTPWRPTPSCFASFDNSSSVSTVTTHVASAGTPLS
eukprot:TRINITY_DN3949_c0_g1_i2.p1 TRINITY_DN3949_c0_g1~~TRINITY_DN3949_c0_g1_i2.p1  ORF type:complete len:383 (-),score=44.84 TRINITY_DN3949_c0_g1_i2:701-1849(-)